MAIGINWGEVWKPVWKAVWATTYVPAEESRPRGHAYMREGFAQARKRIALQRILDYLTNPEPAEETKRVIRQVKAGKPATDVKKPPVIMAEVSAEKIAERLIPSRVAAVQDIGPELQAVVQKAIRIAQERDDEDVLLLL